MCFVSSVYLRRSSPVFLWLLRAFVPKLCFGSCLILFHIDDEWHVQNVLRAQLTFLTNGLSGKSQLRRPATLGDEAPDAYLIGIQSIAGRCLQLEFPL